MAAVHGLQRRTALVRIGLIGFNLWFLKPDLAGESRSQLAWQQPLLILAALRRLR